MGRSRCPASMSDAEYETLTALVDSEAPARTLEIGMAHGGSSEVLCRWHHRNQIGRHTAIDPFQSDISHWNSAGIERLKRQGLWQYCTLIEKPSYLALPELVSNGDVFDCVLIDGWHSFDFTLVDMFYGDLLLRDGGVMIVHDANLPSVYRALRFLETHKPYDRLSSRLLVDIPYLSGRVARRVWSAMTGHAHEDRERRRRWHRFGVYKKRRAYQVDNAEYWRF